MTRTIVWTPAMPALGRAVIALGVFDGVHLGHQTLIHDAVALAREQGALAVVVTFDRDPDQVVAPAGAAPQLLELPDKLALLEEQSADVVLVMPFTEELAATSPLAFLDEVLLGSLTPVAVVVGYDFRFGHRAEGTVDVLVRYGAVHGFRVVAHELVHEGDAAITSTRIRGLIAAGDVVQAARLLGRPHRLRGVVAHGRGVGITLHAPTANLTIDAYAAEPGDGVYAGRAVIAGHPYAAAVSIGVPPSFPEAPHTLEVHVLDFDGDLYGRTLTLEFIQRLRDLQRFDDPRDLSTAIQADITAIRRIVGL